MTQPSKGASLFLALFGLPFLGAGLFFIYAQLASSGNFGNGSRIFGIMFGLVFAAIGAGLMYAAIGGYGRLKKQAAIEEGNPLSPWLWRTDWASRRAESLKPEDRNHLLGDLHFLEHDPPPGGRRACTEDGAQR